MSNREYAASGYIDALRGDRWEDAYHSLIELGVAAVPVIAEAYRDPSQSDLRQILLRIIGQTRSNNVVSLLSDGLEDQDANIWKEALDALTALGTHSALNVIRDARRRANSEKSEWLDEAIEQITDRMAETGEAER
jgi:hypothetical protein